LLVAVVVLVVDMVEVVDPVVLKLVHFLCQPVPSQ
tara:strand:+ start:65 stop:169 length:105 start_codon:yes stop_codon:yes gene_type:complete